MIEANELRIGNFIKGKGMNIYWTVSGIEGELVHANGQWRLLKAFEPFPVTEECLVDKMGFKEVKSRDGIRKAFKNKSIRIELSNSGNFYFKGRPLRGIHDVQNVYFHNEYEELTIN